MSKLKIRDLNLHDSKIIDINIQRSESEADIIDITLKYIENYEKCETSDKVLRFIGCYKFIGNMNFNYGSCDPILNALNVKPSGLLNEVRESWGKVDKKFLSIPLEHYRIETSTTGSVFDIVASSIELIDMKE